METEQLEDRKTQDNINELALKFGDCITDKPTTTREIIGAMAVVIFSMQNSLPDEVETTDLLGRVYFDIESIKDFATKQTMENTNEKA